MKLWSILFLFFSFFTLCHTFNEENTKVNIDKKYALKITVVMSGRNTEASVQESVQSVMLQDYPTDKFQIVYVDDNSTDSTYDKLKELQAISPVPLHIIRTEKHLGPAYGRMAAVKLAGEDEIIVLVDGDDYLIHDKVLATVQNTYVSTDAWITFGGHIRYPNWDSIRYSNVKYTEMRKKQRHSFAHMRTFYSWLVKQINETDLKDADGNYYQGATDISIILPVVEMAHDSSRIYRFPDNDPMYIYMVSTQTYSKALVKSRLDMAISIFNKKPYERLAAPLVELPEEVGLLEVYPRTPTSTLGSEAFRHFKLPRTKD